MSGPIVRTGATPEFWKNWDQIFGKKPRGKQKTAGSGSPDEKKSARAPKKKAVGRRTTASGGSKKVGVKKKLGKSAKSRRK